MKDVVKLLNKSIALLDESMDKINDAIETDETDQCELYDLEEIQDDIQEIKEGILNKIDEIS